ncbi:hypothetical protein [Hymenobacter daecheongensis]|uniref:hypothetical protein n=1 Tax=Hymenobacter daecheongensis TaxID=496053 RepID=UPI0011610EAE|nr:hypothetical protein [Hymenobacter daecheongensis]
MQLRTQTAAAGTPLPRKHRALVALYMLEDPRQSREEILRLNNVSEIDLAEYEEEWLRLRCRHVVAV